MKLNLEKEIKQPEEKNITWKVNKNSGSKLILEKEIGHLGKWNWIWRSERNLKVSVVPGARKTGEHKVEYCGQFKA